MSTGRDRERRLAREHHERQQRRHREAVARARRRNLVIAAVVAVALVVVGLVVTGVLAGDDEGTSSTASPAQTPAVEDCVDAPAPVASPSSYASAPAPDPADVSTATIATTCGDLTVELLGQEAPATVSSFAFLAAEGFFDATPCHRLTTSGIYVLQCGDPTGTGTGGPGYSIPLENAPSDETYPAGTLAMARSQDPGSGGSQFFVVYQESQLPAPGYTVFGRVTDGLDLVERVAAAGADDANGPGDGAPAQPVGITSVTVS